MPKNRKDGTYLFGKDIMSYLMPDSIEAATAKAIAIGGTDIFLLLLGKSEAKALALNDIARLAFKRLFATGAMFGFVAGHEKR